MKVKKVLVSREMEWMSRDGEQSDRCLHFHHVSFSFSSFPTTTFFALFSTLESNEYYFSSFFPSSSLSTLFPSTLHEQHLCSVCYTLPFASFSLNVLIHHFLDHQLMLKNVMKTLVRRRGVKIVRPMIYKQRQCRTKSRGWTFRGRRGRKDEWGRKNKL